MSDGTPQQDAEQQSRKSVFFDINAEPDPAYQVMNPDRRPDAKRPAGVAEHFMGRLTSNRVFSDKEDDGMCLTIFRIAPGTVFPRHHHDVDYIELVLEGEVHHGNRVLKVGEGVYRPAGAVYTYAAGPEGAVIADFRAHTYYGTEWVDDPAAFPSHREW